jgi:hypothetical protein
VKNGDMARLCSHIANGSLGQVGLFRALVQLVNAGADGH